MKRSDLPADFQRKRYLKLLAGFGLMLPFTMNPESSVAKDREMLIDDFASNDLRSRLGTQWRGVSDRVMGGVSDVSVMREKIDGRTCLRLKGYVRLENNGGFIQAALDLAPTGETFDASKYAGVRLMVRGNGEQYSAHLRTPDNVRPWQSYRAQFKAGSTWQEVDLPFRSFVPYRLQLPLNIAHLKRLGLVAIGREFGANLAVAEIAFYR